LISVVITLFNKAAYIQRALKSVIEQPVRDLEILVIDDGSTDGGSDIVKRMGDPRIRLFYQNNAGAGASRNRGIREARGELIAMLDGDDQWLPGFLEAILELSRLFPAAGIYATGYRKIVNQKYCLETTLLPVPSAKLLVKDYFARARIANFVWTSAQAIPKIVYDDVGGFIEGQPMGEDLDLWGRIASRYPIGYDCRILSHYRTDALGRVAAGHARKPTFPPFVDSAREYIKRGLVDKADAPALHDYLNRILLDYIVRVIAAGDRDELKKVLSREFYSGRHYRIMIALLKIASMILPMPTIRFIERALLSRWTFVVMPVQVRANVLLRASRLKRG
jgi:glycosyltransferase involved in cell wall biosynthesis